MSDVAIRVEGISKQFKIGAPENYRTLRDSLSGLFRKRTQASAASANTFWALKDVSFEIKQGEVVGIIGRNGAGKSTLLKILSRITEPTSGRAEIYGRVGSLLEVGTGFHPELSGRENIFLNGAILGMKRTEILRKFDEIVAFAEVEKFIDTPVKHYSSGMYVRLAFAVAAHMEPEVLIVDEVLSVGDSEFQKKCLGKMDDAARSGRSIVFVSHQMSQIRRLCDRAVWMAEGRVHEIGPTPEVTGAYEVASAGRTPHGGDSARGDSGFRHWRLCETTHSKPHSLMTTGTTEVSFVLDLKRPVSDAVVGVALYNSELQLIWANSFASLHLPSGVNDLNCSLEALPVKPGVYMWKVSLWADGKAIDIWDCLPPMNVCSRPLSRLPDNWQGILNLRSQLVVGRADEQASTPVVADNEY